MRKKIIMAFGIAFVMADAAFADIADAEQRIARLEQQVEALTKTRMD